MASLIDPDAPPLLHMCCFGVPVEKVRLYGSSQSWLLKIPSTTPFLMTSRSIPLTTPAGYAIRLSPVPPVVSGMAEMPAHDTGWPVR